LSDRQGYSRLSKHDELFALRNLQMRHAFRILALLGCVLIRASSPAIAAEDDWTVATIARDGSWGVATSSSQAQAIALAIRDCKAMARAQSDCGAQFATIRSGWLVAELCGDHKIIAADKSLREAEKAAMDRQIDLQLFYVADLPTCRRTLTADPTGAFVAGKQQRSVDEWLGFAPVDAHTANRSARMREAGSE